MSIITVGIDLAKNFFSVCRVDENGKAGLIKPNVAREQLLNSPTLYQLDKKQGAQAIPHYLCPLPCYVFVITSNADGQFLNARFML